ncbi:MAG TPA: hypothetical protein VKZ45_00780, partial [Vicingaceae bacterium]|nr:hypothetical protein [Vicingaceae bacterium]
MEKNHYLFWSIGRHISHVNQQGFLVMPGRYKDIFNALNRWFVHHPFAYFFLKALIAFLVKSESTNLPL